MWKLDEVSPSLGELLLAGEGLPVSRGWRLVQGSLGIEGKAAGLLLWGEGHGELGLPGSSRWNSGSGAPICELGGPAMPPTRQSSLLLVTPQGVPLGPSSRKYESLAPRAGSVLLW